MEIRPASLLDLATIRSIGEETYRQHFSSIWSAPGLERFLQQDFSEQALRGSLTSRAHSWLLVEEADGSVAGYAKINWSRPAPISNSMGAELQKIYFSPSATGKGYGRRLVDSIVGLAIGYRQDSIWLGVLKSNSGARRFYTGQGFIDQGEIPFRTDLFEIGMRVMQRRLVADTALRPDGPPDAAWRPL